jgi:hypothetical protein
VSSVGWVDEQSIEQVLPCQYILLSMRCEEGSNQSQSRQHMFPSEGCSLGQMGLKEIQAVHREFNWRS